MLGASKFLFDRDMINRFYNLSTIEYDKYHSIVEGDFNWDLVVSTLCHQGTQWTRNKKERIKSIPHKSLLQAAKI